MWLIQECRRAWLDKNNYTWDEMVKLASGSEPFKYLINPDDSCFLNPKNMPEAIIEYCAKTGQGKPENHAQIIRCVYDSLALKYRFTLEQILTVSEEPIERIHIIGGGANNRFLNQLTADATKLKVVAGPTEATATGNILLQAKAMGALQSLAEMRTVVRHSFEVEEFTPGSDLDWDAAYQRYTGLK